MTVLSKSLVKVGLVGFGNITNAALGFAFLAATAKVLDLNSFGKYALLTTLLLSISKIVDFGTNSVFVAKSISKEEGELTNLFVTTKILLSLLTFPLFLIALLLLHEINFPIVVILTIGSVAYTINYTLFGLLQRKQKYGALAKEKMPTCSNPPIFFAIALLIVGHVSVISWDIPAG